MAPLAVYLGADLVNDIAHAHAHSVRMKHTIPVLLGLWFAAGAQRALGAYMAYGRNMFVRNVQLEAERRLVEQAARIDLGHFDNSDWHDRLARARREVSFRPADLTWSVLGLSGYLVTVVLMAALLATLHYLLVVLALTSAALVLVIEGGMTSQLYTFFFDDAAQERECDYLSNLLIEPCPSGKAA